MKYFVIYMFVINVVAFSMYGIDKFKAKHNRWRISESMLIGLAVAGGFIGAFAGMQIFRHKTKHMKFVIGVPLIAVLWVSLCIYLFTQM